MGWEGLNLIHLAEEKQKGQGLVNTVINLSVS
jgi:hypothetical protein